MASQRAVDTVKRQFVTNRGAERRARLVKTATSVTPQGRAVKGASKVAGKVTGSRVQSITSARTPNRSRVRSNVSRTANRPLPNLVPKGNTGTLVAEFLAGVVLIGVGIILSNKPYAQSMSRGLLQLTGLSAVFFVLALIGGGENSGRFAKWFGFLVILGLLFNAVKAGIVRRTGLVVAGKPSGASDTVLADYQTVTDKHVISA